MPISVSPYFASSPLRIDSKCKPMAMRRAAQAPATSRHDRRRTGHRPPPACTVGQAVAVPGRDPSQCNKFAAK